MIPWRSLPRGTWSPAFLPHEPPPHSPSHQFNIIHKADFMNRFLECKLIQWRLSINPWVHRQLREQKSPVLERSVQRSSSKMPQTFYLYIFVWFVHHWGLNSTWPIKILVIGLNSSPHSWFGTNISLKYVGPTTNWCKKTRILPTLRQILSGIIRTGYGC